MGKEFLNINGNVKEKLIRVTGNIDLLKGYLDNPEKRKKLSSSEIEHLEYRIENMEEFEKLAKYNMENLDKRKSLIAPVEREDGTLELVHIHQDKVQNTFNGCWSVSLQLLLQSRGIQLTQEQIRAFRPNFTDEKEVESLGGEETFNQDKKALLELKADLVTKLLPNTSLNHVEISKDPSKREYSIDKFKKIVAMALKEDNSPVSMVTNGHFRTIVGIKGNELLLKDSIQFRMHGANHTYRVSIDEILEKNAANLFWLHDMKLEKDGSCAELAGNSVLSYKEGKLQVGELKSLTGKETEQKIINVHRALSADAEECLWTKEGMAFSVETSKLKNIKDGYGGYTMNLPKEMYPAVPRKIRRYTEAEIELIDRLKGREVLEDIQMKLNVPDKNGLYPVMKEEDLKELNDAYEKVSNLYAGILEDKNVNLSEKQKQHLIGLKENVDKEKQIFSNLQKSEDGVLPTYREALRKGMRELEGSVHTQCEQKSEFLQNLQGKFAELDKSGHKNSKEYTEMVNSAKKLQLAVELISNPDKWQELGFKSPLNEYQRHEFLRRAEKEAERAVDTYIKEKGNPYTKFGKDRLAVAKELKAGMSKRISTALKEEKIRLEEEELENQLKEHVRLKEASKTKPAFSSDEIRATLAKYEIGTAMYDLGNKALAALETLNGMKYQKDHATIEQNMSQEALNKKNAKDKERLKDSMAKVIAFTMLSERKFENPEMKNPFSVKYSTKLIEALKNTELFNNYSLEQWSDILEKKEGAPTLQQICAKFSENDLILQDTRKTLEKNDKQIENSVQNLYMIYSPTKINFDEQNSVGISKYVKNMNAVKDAKYDIKVPENVKVDDKEVALLTLLQLATMKVGMHYKDENTSDDRGKMLGGVAWSIENTFAQRDADEKNLGVLIDKERQELSDILKAFAEGRKEPMQNFMKEALDNFKVALLPEQGLTEKARFAAKIGSDIFELLEKHQDFLPETMNPEHIKTYKAFKECSQLVEEVAQARKDLATIDYNNLNDSSVREKFEDAMAKVIAEGAVNADIIKDYQQQNKKIESVQEEMRNKIGEEMKEAEKNLKSGDEHNAENVKVMESYVHRINNLNSVKLEMLKAPKILMDFDANAKKELIVRIKSSNLFKEIIKGVCEKTKQKESFLINPEEFLKQTTDKMMKQYSHIITRELSLSAVQVQEKIKKEQEAAKKAKETSVKTQKKPEKTKNTEPVINL